MAGNGQRQSLGDRDGSGRWPGRVAESAQEQDDARRMPFGGFGNGAFLMDATLSTAVVGFDQIDPIRQISTKGAALSVQTRKKLYPPRARPATNVKMTEDA